MLFYKREPKIANIFLVYPLLKYKFHGHNPVSYTHLDVYKRQKLKRTNIISGEIAFPESSGRATVEPKKAESTTYIKIPRIMKKTVLSEIASARCWVIGEFGARKSLTTGISALKIQTATKPIT